MHHPLLVRLSLRTVVRCALPVALAIGFSSGCGTDDDGGGDVPASELSSRLSAVVCEKIASCCTASPLAQSPTICAAQIEQLFDVNTYEASIAAGRMEYDGSNVSTCLNRLRGASCAQIEGGLDSLLDCEDPFKPLVANGGGCSLDEECIQGVCSFADETATEGTCLAPVLDGPCARRCGEFGGERTCFSTCGDEAGLVCNGANEGATCVAQEVIPGAGIGDSCEMNFCDEGFCNASQVCEAYRAGGQACTEDSQCDSFECDAGVCGDVSFCATVGG